MVRAERKGSSWDRGGLSFFLHTFCFLRSFLVDCYLYAGILGPGSFCFYGAERGGDIAGAGRSSSDTTHTNTSEPVFFFISPSLSLPLILLLSQSELEDERKSRLS